MTPRKQDRPLTARLAQLGAALVATKQRERERVLEHRRVAGEIAQLTDAVADAFADDDEARAAKASKQRASLEQGGLREAEERLEGARRAARRADVERAAFAAENIDGLIAERRGDALAVARAVEDAVAELGQAHARWNGVESEVAALLRLAGRDTRDVPTFPERLATLVRDARRADGLQVPAPLPGQRAFASVASYATLTKWFVTRRTRRSRARPPDDRNGRDDTPCVELYRDGAV
jgi:hypothetical protein